MTNFKKLHIRLKISKIPIFLCICLEFCSSLLFSFLIPIINIRTCLTYLNQLFSISTGYTQNDLNNIKSEPAALLPEIPCHWLKYAKIETINKSIWSSIFDCQGLLQFEVVELWDSHYSCVHCCPLIVGGLDNASRLDQLSIMDGGNKLTESKQASS